MTDDKVAEEILSAVRLIASDDEMSKEKLSKMYLELERWTMRKLKKVPSHAPIAVQILQSLQEVRKRLKGKPASGREAVEAMMKAMSGLYTVDAAPLKRLWRKYDSAEELLYKYGILP